MNLSNHTKVFWAVFISILMTNVPALAWAETAEGMISTATVVDQLTREQAQEKVQNFLNREEVRKELAKRGVSPNEVSSRLASLSERELNQLAQQMDQAQFGGDPTGILVIVLLVVLIIFLVRRI